MRIEGENQRRTTQFAGFGDDTLDDPRMTQVYAVEITDRHRPAAQLKGQIG